MSSACNIEEEFLSKMQIKLINKWSNQSISRNISASIFSNFFVVVDE